MTEEKKAVSNPLLCIEDFVKNYPLKDTGEMAELAHFEQVQSEIIVDGLYSIIADAEIVRTGHEYIIHSNGLFIDSTGIIVPTIHPLEKVDFESDDDVTRNFKMSLTDAWDTTEEYLDKRPELGDYSHYEVYDDYANYVAMEFLRTLNIPEITNS
ncbi:hypothetical protein AB6E89_01310 [Vibrio breoganii]